MKQILSMLIVSFSIAQGMKKGELEKEAGKPAHAVIEIKEDQAAEAPSEMQKAAAALLGCVKFFSSKGYTSDDIAPALASYFTQKTASSGTPSTVGEMIDLFRNKTPENKITRGTVLTDLLDHVVNNKEVKTAQAEALTDVATGNLQKSKIGMYILGGL